MSSVYWTLATRYLWGRKLRTALTTLAVVFGVLVLFSLNIVLPAFIGAFQANVLGLIGQTDLTVTHRTGEAFSPATAETVRSVAGVRAAVGYYNRTLNLPRDFVDQDPDTLDRVTAILLVGLEADTTPQLRSYVIETGRFLTAEDTQAAVITASLAEAMGVGVGDALTLPTTTGTTTFVIVGLRPVHTIAGSEEVLVPLAAAQQAFNQPGLINTLEVGYTTIDEPERQAITVAVAEALGDDFRQGALTTGTEFFATLQLAQTAMNLFGVAALIMGGFIIFNTFRTVVAERRRDLAMLRALGADRRTIIGAILVEGLLQGLVGTLVGMAAGYVLGASLLAGLSGVIRQFVNINLGVPVVPPWLVAVSLILGVGVTVLSGLLPALSASQVSPLEALRPAPGEVEQRIARWSAVAGAVLIGLAALGLASGHPALGGLGALLILIGLVLVAPALVRPIAQVFGRVIALAFARNGVGPLAEGNLTRQPSRAAITASTTMIGLAILVAMAGLITSLTGSFRGILRRSLGSDYLLIPPSIGMWATNMGARGALADDLRAVEGVAVVSTTRFAASSAPAPASLKASAGEVAISVLGIDPATFPQVSGLNFEAGDPAAAWAELAEGRTLIVNGPMASQFQLEVGDTLALATPTGPQTYLVVGVANDFLNAKFTTAYTAHANLAADFQKTEDILLQINLAPGVASATAEPQLRDIAARYPQFNFVAGEQYVRENEGLFDQAFGALYVLFFMLSLPSFIAILNTLAIGVIERTREIGMVRAVGATRTQIRGMVLAEAALLAAIGTALGLLGGLYLGYVGVSAMKFGGFTLAYQFPYWGVAVAVAFGLLSGVLAALLPARQAAQLDIVEALRYE